jgi:hypothetical protein
LKEKMCSYSIYVGDALRDFWATVLWLSVFWATVL